MIEGNFENDYPVADSPRLVRLVSTNSFLYIKTPTDIIKLSR